METENEFLTRQLKDMTAQRDLLATALVEAHGYLQFRIPPMHALSKKINGALQAVADADTILQEEAAKRETTPST